MDLEFLYVLSLPSFTAPCALLFESGLTLRSPSGN